MFRKGGVDVAQIDDGIVPTFSDLQLRPLNVERGDARFREADGNFSPRAASWRNNLTALSQKRNLFFVAYRHQVYVWEPAGSRQTLGAKPTMIITPMMKQPNARGYISWEFPHALNNLVVDDLGRDEILLLATDSGNVCGYHIETIFSEIARARENGQKRPFLYQHTDPFFCENVGASAWGLAVHKYARLIAVSANTRVVTVFAFALAEPHSGRDDDSDRHPALVEDCHNYQQNWLCIDEPEQFEQLQKLIPRNHRSRNVRLSYKSHLTNIPNVAFLNSDLDPNGMWMLSTDIDNRLNVWSIWNQRTPFAQFDFHSGDPLPDILRPEERGWNVLALDPRSFRTYGLYTEACGGKPYIRNQTVLDITNISQNVRDSSTLIDSLQPLDRDDEDEPSFPNIFDSESSIGKASRHSIITQNHSTGYSSRTDQDIETLHRGIGDNVPPQTSADILRVPPASHERNDVFFSEEEHAHGNIEYAESEYTMDTDWEDRVQNVLDVLSSRSDFSDETRTGVENTEPIAISDYACEPFQTYTVAGYGFTDFPILYFSETDIQLLENPLSQPSAVVCAGPLRQHFSHTVYTINSFDRFNMVKYLPEDGIVIAATQKGRAAIISLGRVSGGALTLRTHWILPLASQERHGDRPLMPLLGIAVSPIQGFEKTADVPDVPDKTSSQNDISFHYRFHDKGDADWCENASLGGDSGGSNDEEDEQSDNSSETSEDTSGPTDAECHGAANWTYEPSEPWQGWNPSRRYRLLLTYADHTVLSYEFWYEWSEAVLKNYTHTRGKYPDDGCDDYLLL